MDGRLALLFRFAAAASMVVCAPAYAQPAPPRIHVRGSAFLDAQATRQPTSSPSPAPSPTPAPPALPDNALVVTGTLRDDAGTPIADTAIRVQATRGSSAQAVRFTDLGAVPTSCAAGPGGASPRLALEGDTTALAPVDESGRFCVLAPLPLDRYAIHLSTAPTPLLDAATADLSIDLAKRALTLRFDPPPRVLSLDRDDLFVDTAATVDDGQSAPPGLFLTFTDERAQPLGSAVTDAQGRARLPVLTAKLGAPGPGALRVAFPGNDQIGEASQTIPVERRARVTLRLEHEIAGGAPEDGVPIDVVAGDVRGGAPSGSIEARVGGVVVGAGTLTSGRAKVVATFSAEASTVPVTLTYLPDAPWYQAGDPVTVEVPVRGPSPWRDAPLVVTAVGIVAFLAFGRLGKRGARAEARGGARPGKDRGQVPAGPRIDVVRAGPPGERRWTGRVVDAHDLSPIARARIVVEHASFGQRELAASSFADDEGRFVIEPARVLEDARLVVEGPFHASVQRKMPPPGELEIALVSRKRAILDRLVAWARARGRPFDARPEPTPAHVKRAAGDDLRAARWAEAVERAAFAPGDVDATAEQEVDRLAPPDPNRDAHAGAGGGPQPDVSFPRGQQTQVRG